MTPTIYVSAGAKEYLAVEVTETSGADISGDTVQIALGSRSAPEESDWKDADVSGGAGGKLTAKLLIGDTYVPSAGSYVVWARITDTPEVVPAQAGIVTIA